MKIQKAEYGCAGYEIISNDGVGRVFVSDLADFVLLIKDIEKFLEKECVEAEL